MKLKIFLVIITTLFLISLISAVRTGGGEIGIDLIPETPINYSIQTVNASEIWITSEGNLDNVVDILGSWITNDEGWINSIWNIFDQSLNTTDDVDFNDLDLTGSMVCQENITADWFRGKFNWTSGDTWNIFNGSILTFNESKLETTYFNASAINVVTGTSSGNLEDIQSYNNVYYNITEDLSDYELIVNFTNITSFTTLIVRHKTDDEGVHIARIQIWDYVLEDWEGYGYLTEATTAEIKTIGVYDDDDHIQNGVVQVRFFQEEVGNLGHIQGFDWVALSKGFGTPVGQEIDPIYKSEIGNYLNSSEVRTEFLNLSGTNANQNINISPYNFTTTGNISADNYCNTTNCYSVADFLIDTSGGDNESWNESYADTKYVPYTGANANVDLGAFNLTTTGRIGAGAEMTSPEASIHIETGKLRVISADDKGALEAGNDHSDDITGGGTLSATGDGCIAMGVAEFQGSILATGEGAIAGGFTYGTNSQILSDGGGSIAWGYAADSRLGVFSTGHPSLAFGTDVRAEGDRSFALGTLMNVTGNDAFGIGLGNTAGEIAGNNIMSIMGGNVGIGTTAPAEKLEVAGSIQIQNGGTIGNPSDERLQFRTSAIGVFINDGELITLDGDIKIANGATVGNMDDTEKFQFRAGGGGEIGFICNNEEAITIINNGDIGIGTTTPSYPLEVRGNGSNNITIWAEGNISAEGFVTRTSIFDKSKNVWDYIKDADYYKDNGIINHSKFYGYAGKFEITDYTKPENKTSVVEECINETCKNISVTNIIYPYKKIEEGVSLEKEIDVLRQAVYEQQQIIEQLELRITALEKK